MAKNLSLPVPHRHRLSCLLFLILRFINDNYGNFGDVVDTIFRMKTPIPIPFSTPSSHYMSPPPFCRKTPNAILRPSPSKWCCQNAGDNRPVHTHATAPFQRMNVQTRMRFSTKTISIFLIIFIFNIHSKIPKNYYLKIMTIGTRKPPYVTKLFIAFSMKKSPTPTPTVYFSHSFLSINYTIMANIITIPSIIALPNLAFFNRQASSFSCGHLL